MAAISFTKQNKLAFDMGKRTEQLRIIKEMPNWIAKVFEKLENEYEEKYDDEPVPFDDIENLIIEELKNHLEKKEAK